MYNLTHFSPVGAAFCRLQPISPLGSYYYYHPCAVVLIVHTEQTVFSAQCVSVSAGPFCFWGVRLRVVAFGWQRPVSHTVTDLNAFKCVEAGDVLEVGLLPPSCGQNRKCSEQVRGDLYVLNSGGTCCCCCHLRRRHLFFKLFYSLDKSRSNRSVTSNVNGATCCIILIDKDKYKNPIIN